MGQDKAEDGGDAVASLTDDNAVLAQKAGECYSIINAMLYQVPALSPTGRNRTKTTGNLLSAAECLFDIWHTKYKPEVYRY